MDLETRDIVTSQTPRRIFKILLKKKREVRKQELLEFVSLSRGGLDYRLRQLEDEKLIQIDGGKRTSYVKLTQEGKKIAEWPFPKVKTENDD